MDKYVNFFLNKVIEENDVGAISRHNIREDDIFSEVERQVYRFIKEHSLQNEGNAPSYAMVVTEFPDFVYVPEIRESFETLAKGVKDEKGRQLLAMTFNGGELNKKFSELPTADFIQWAIKQFENIYEVSTVTESVGKSIKTDAEVFLEEYFEIKEGKSVRTWKSSFSSIGSYDSGNVYVIYGKSGRGKSVIALREAVEVALQGGTVLYWGMELNWYQIMSRLYALISGRGELIKHRVDPRYRAFAQADGTIDGGFNPRDLQRAKLDGTLEETFKKMLGNLSNSLEGDIIIRAVDDPDFTGRTVDDLKADIIKTGADFVIVDPFYYMDYEKNISRKTGGDAEATSKKLKRLTGELGVPIVSLTQAEENDNEDSKDGSRELAMPKRNEVMKSSALLQDASLLIGVDTNYLEGAGLVGVNKGRDGGEGNISNIIFLPQYGIVEENFVGASAIGVFDKF